MSVFAPIASDNITLQPRGAKRQSPAKSMQAAASRCPMLSKSIWHQFRTTVECIPTAEAVEVVRCKDCKHFHENTFGNEIGFPRGHILSDLIVGHETCDRWSEGHNQVTAEGFCFLAERRDQTP